MPLLLVYEIGAVVILSQAEVKLVATQWMGKFFEVFGVTGVHLPAIAVVAVLLGMHLMRKRDPWAPEFKLYLVMYAEAALLAIPLFVFMTVLLREPLSAWAVSGEAWSGWREDMIVALGAGIYEELVFRLIAIALIHMLAKDLLALPEEICVGASVVISSLGFALIHFIGPTAFNGGLFLLYFVAGIYFAAIYLSRGFGLAVAVHAFYDVLAFTKEHLYLAG